VGAGRWVRSEQVESVSGLSPYHSPLKIDGQYAGGQEYCLLRMEMMDSSSIRPAMSMKRLLLLYSARNSPDSDREAWKTRLELKARALRYVDSTYR
jgi:hypothetical protein